MAKPLRRRLENRLAELKQERLPWEPMWRDIRDHINPARGRFTLGEERRSETVNRKIINTTPRRALRVAESGLMSGMTSPSRPWLRLSMFAGNDDPAAKAWLYTVQTRMAEIMRVSNLYQSLALVYRDLLQFGSAVLLIIDDFDDIIRTDVLACGRFWIATDSKGRVATLFREFEMTVEQLVERFGLDACSDVVQAQWRQEQYDTRIDVCHAMYRRKDRDGSSAAPRNKPYASCYWETARAGDEFLVEGGSSRPQFIGCRWDMLDGEDYGVSPGMEALGQCKSLQQQERDLAELRHRLNRPTMNAPSSLRRAGRRPSQIPGGVNYLAPGDMQKGRMEPAFTVDSRALAELREGIRETERRIDEAFFVDLFLMFVDLDRRQITAEEIIKRYEEKILMLGPVIERLHDELLKPLVDNIFQRMLDVNLVPPPPPSVEGRDIKVEFVSLLAQAQKAAGIATIERTLGMAGLLAGMGRVDALDKIDPDAILDETNEIAGAPPNILLSADAVAQIRQQRAEQQQQQSLIENAQGLAGAGRLISEATARGEGVI